MKKYISVVLSIAIMMMFFMPAYKVKTEDEIISTEERIPAFPGAEGYGAYATGGRGGEVYEVTNLNDSGEGSLRDAVSKPNRIVIFRVSGTIHLKSPLRIQGNITIAGQTAPGDGICVSGYPTIVEGDNVIIRYMRFRLGDQNSLQSDSFNINNVENVIVDHCSFSWGVDENVSVYNNKNVTIQWCIISEGLNRINHSCGGLWGPRSSYHHNLFVHNKTRNPKLAYLDGDKVDFRNNVIYNWGEMSVYTGSQGLINIVGNYYKPGPSTISNITTIVQTEPTVQLYCADNYFYGFPEITEDNWKGVKGECIRVDTPFDVPPVTTHTAEQAYRLVLAEAGASLPTRDAVDKRIIEDVINGTGSIILSQEDVGGYPLLRSTTPPIDSDHDGMPDEWEITMGLDPYDPSDRNGDIFGYGYTNVEYYINSLAHDSQHKPIISITSPVANSIYTAPANITIQTDIFTIDASISKVEFYNGEELIAEVTSPPYSFTWMNVPDGTYYLTAKVTDSRGLTSVSETVPVHVNEETEILPWMALDLGSPPITGNSAIANGIFTIKGSGEIGGNSDSCHYLFQKLNGDGEIIARIDDITPFNDSSEAGIMMRNDLKPDSASVMLGISCFKPSSSGLEMYITFKYRIENGSEMEVLSTSVLDSFPCWLRLSRQGNLFTAYMSQDGINWLLVGSSNIVMNHDIYIGLTASTNEVPGGSIANYNTTRFSNVDIIGELPPVLLVEQGDSITNNPKFNISGTVNKKCKIEISINNRKEIKKVVNKNLCFNFVTKLEEGLNVIDVQAYLTQIIVNGRVVAEVPSDGKLKLHPNTRKVKVGSNIIKLVSENGDIKETYELSVDINDSGLPGKMSSEQAKHAIEYPVEIKRVVSKATITVILDTIPPVITPDIENVTVNKQIFTISGSVNEKSIVKIGINGDSIIEVPVDEKFRFSTDVELKLGTNEVTLQAVDSAGNISAEKVITVTFIDDTPPVIEYNEYLLQHEPFVINVADEISGVKELVIKINNKIMSMEDLEKLILPPGPQNVYVKAVDMWGNIAEVNFIVNVQVYVNTLADVIGRGLNLDLIKGADSYESLITKSNAILMDRYVVDKAIERLNELYNEVEKQLLDQKIDASFGQLLFLDIEYLKNLYMSGRLTDVCTLCLKFDFGPGPVADGYTQILCNTQYTYLLGYGLFGGTNMHERNRNLSDALKRDFVVGDNFEFKVDLPNGRYSVTFISGDKDATQAEFDVKAEGILIFEGLSAPKNQFIEKTFEITVYDGQLNMQFIGRIVRINALEIIPLEYY